MTTPSNAATASVRAVPETATDATRGTRPLYWSLRRELWENRWLYAAPIAFAALVLLGFLIGAITQPHRVPAMLAFQPARSSNILAEYDLAASMGVMVAALLVGVFYCIEALQGERRDRSILFWKSLPVSDATTILSKAIIPMVVLPALTCALIAATQLLMLLVGSAVLLLTGADAGPVWAAFPFQLWPLLLYFFVGLTLWHAPLYGWLLLVSAWARRAAFLWATLPLLAISVVERLAFNTSHVAGFLMYRWMGFFGEAFAVTAPAHQSVERLPRLTPGHFLTTPGLWLGLAFTAACLFAAVRLRRHRDPI